ncbi:hypothetical protein ES332_A11G223400v1 [Gossypium tomentosum]|uniref:Pre-mRNA-splicing factor 38 n=1 Tax=Gossypium tomentosum TaxID=34277 RepID=A0A5D2NF39_GOSTO|nr:hypothetical protein ES332_A11G223400v1 [Gossypium tomentosum]
MGFLTFHEVIDEIYNQDDHVEPRMTGNCRGLSTVFYLLYKFFTMKLTVKQIHGLLKHLDSPYIGAILSLRRIGTISRLLCHPYSGYQGERKRRKKSFEEIGYGGLID